MEHYIDNILFVGPWGGVDFCNTQFMRVVKDRNQIADNIITRKKNELPFDSRAVWVFFIEKKVNSQNE